MAASELSVTLRMRAIATQLAAMDPDVRKGRLHQMIAQGMNPGRLPIVPVTSARNVLSYAQLRQWFLWQLDRQSTAYHISVAVRLEGKLDVSALKASFDALVARHESLRTVFRAREDGEVEQVVMAQARALIEELDVSAVDARQRQGRVRSEATRLEQTPFDLEVGPLLRIGLIRVASQEHVLVVVMHHIVSDGWSMQILIDEFVRQYRARVEGEQLQLAALPIQYADYAIWQRSWLEAGEKDRQLAYWKGQLGTEHPVLQLPSDHARRADGRYTAGLHTVELSAVLTSGLQRRAQAEGATLFMVLLTGFQALLHRYTGQEEIRVGVPIANRHRVETEGVVGFFVNTQVLSNRLQGRMSLEQVLRQAKGAALGAQSYQDLPFEQLVEALQPQRSLGSSPLFQVMFNHQRQEARGQQTLPGLRLEGCELGERAAQYELTVDSREEGDGRVRVSFTYAKELFEARRIERLTDHYVALLCALAQRPDQAVSEVELLSELEHAQLREWGVNTQRSESLEPVHRLIEREVRARGDATALLLEEQTLSYAQLNRSANRLAHRLIELGVKPEVKVGIALERSVEMVVGLLAILKAGGAYVPLDPEYPRERLKYMVEDSGIELLLTHSGVRERVASWDGLPVLELDTLDVSGEPEHDPAVELHGENLAYVIYTSGSTGRPKGVMVRHGALSQFMLSTKERPGMESEDTLVAVTPLSFDIAALEIYLPLLTGAKIVLAAYEVSRNGDALAELIERSGATVLQCTPASWRLLRASGWSGAPGRRFKALCGGEALQPDLAQDLRSIGLELWNMYGPTETTIWSSTAELSDDVHLGQAIANTQLYVLDADLNTAPIGVSGDLYLGGAGLARGYHARAELTAERFIADLFQEHGGRLYRTGDLVQWSGAGRLKYLGRIDHQVKVRGLRIELGEIEAQLLLQPQVREAVVVASEEAEGARLIAYVSASVDCTIDESALRVRLADVLPGYMVPNVVVVLDRLPLNANGKVDRKALPAPEPAHSAAYEPPHGAVEEALAAIWSEVLGVERIGRDDDFFHLGGHSLMAMRIVSRARRLFNCELSLRAVFAHPTLRAQASLIQPLSTAPSGPVFRASNSAYERPPLSYAQQRLWFLWQLSPRSASMNLSIVLRLTGRLDLDAWRFAWQYLGERHSALRTVFRETDGQVWQRVLEESTLEGVSIIDLSALGSDRDIRLMELVAEQMRSPFDLGRGPLLRVHLFRLAEDSHVMCVVMHHIVTDGWSVNVMIRDFAAAYMSRLNGETPNLPPISMRYADFAVGQREWLERGEMQRQLGYWTDHLNGMVPLVMPPERSLPARRSYPCGVVRTSLDHEATLALQAFSKTLSATPFMVLLTVACLAMAERAGQDRFLVGTDLANRNHPETESLVGFFVNQVALPVDCAGPRSARELLMQVKNTVVGAAEHQDLPFDRLVESLRLDRRGGGRAPLFRIKVLYHEDAASPTSLPGLQIDEYAMEPTEIELDLVLVFHADPERILLTIKYDRELFNPPTPECIGQEIVAVLKTWLARPQIDLDTLRAEAGRVRRGYETVQMEERARKLTQRRAVLRARTAKSSS